MDTLENLHALIGNYAATPSVAASPRMAETLDDLGIDSLELVELLLDIEDMFEIELPANLITPGTTVAELFDAVQEAQEATYA